MTAEPIPLIPAVDAETNLIGAVLNGAPLMDLLDVKGTDFSSVQRENTWNAILRLHEKGARPDAVTVNEELQQLPELARPSTVELFDWVQLGIMTASAGYYADIVIRNGGVAALRVAAGKIQQIANTQGGNLDDKQEAARTALDKALRRTQRSEARRLADILPVVMDTADKGKTTATPTGWPDIDRYIGGIAPGRLIVVGARPGVGKSVFACNLASHIAGRHNLGVHFATLEMSEEEVAQRIVASHARIDLTHLTTGAGLMTERDWDALTTAYEKLEAMPLIVDDTSSSTVTGIRAAVRETQRTIPNLALVVVDYLQLIEVAAGTTNRAQALGEVSRQLKILARETQTCVVAAAQVNRESARDNRRPRMSDLRESGAIEADADQIILLHRPDDDLPEIEVIVDKNRHGPKGRTVLSLWGHYATLASTTRSWES